MRDPIGTCINLCAALLGGSELGSFSWNGLPPYADGPFPGGSAYPWGDRNVSNTNPYNNSLAPNTGVTRYYNWTVTNTTLAPDGVELPLLVVNGQFPGPLIEVCSGVSHKYQIYMLTATARPIGEIGYEW